MERTRMPTYCKKSSHSYITLSSVRELTGLPLHRGGKNDQVREWRLPIRIQEAAANHPLSQKNPLPLYGQSLVYENPHDITGTVYRNGPKIMPNDRLKSRPRAEYAEA